MEPSSALFNFILPARVEFGPGVFSLLSRMLGPEEFRKAVFIVTRGRRRSGLLAQPAAALRKEGLEAAIYEGVRENPDLESVADCLRFLREQEPDVLIAVGGGSSLDTAKAAGVCYSNRVESLKELLSRERKRRSLPVLMVPTTAGSGSEVNYWSVITDRTARQKLSFGDPAMSPYAALVDPELCLTLPARATLYTGIDALTHALESYFSVSSNWLSDLLSLGAVSLIVQSLEPVVVDGGNLQARSNMSLASLLAGMSMENAGLGLIHAMSHQVSGCYDTPHGLANALLLPEVLAFNGSACRRKMRSLQGVCPGRRGFQRWLSRLYSRFDIDRRSVCIARGDLEQMSVKAGENVNARTNPAAANRADITGLFERSFTVLD
jgi:alcohol dehydrogenase